MLCSFTGAATQLTGVSGLPTHGPQRASPVSLRPINGSVRWQCEHGRRVEPTGAGHCLAPAFSKDDYRIRLVGRYSWRELDGSFDSDA